ncbi:hypothetical protein AX774_g1549 [Zancudomyces culisetae]|uniref:Stretch-activated cation channel MID1 n=1 Tax=Zancudomyces culisetae TaxID=1213189 RepID=A0A1R1PVK5_ZANCU|nr:hypothetical protein AX774_g1549 [Zancudomyces culisetae]|eukprot:OMH84912.1 hypothetical protein AX774_g1549 [Zancudomyces culisetae]
MCSRENGNKGAFKPQFDGVDLTGGIFNRTINVIKECIRGNEYLSKFNVTFIHTVGLEKATSYQLMSVTPSIVNNKFKEVQFSKEFKTSIGDQCRVVYKVPGCSDLVNTAPCPLHLRSTYPAFDRPITSSQTLDFSKAIQLSLFYSTDVLKYQDKLLDALASANCENRIYSSIATCDDCEKDYNNWLCAVNIPVCMDVETTYFSQEGLGWLKDSGNIFYNSLNVALDTIDVKPVGNTTNKSQRADMALPSLNEKVNENIVGSQKKRADVLVANIKDRINKDTIAFQKATSMGLENPSVCVGTSCSFNFTGEYYNFLKPCIEVCYRVTKACPPYLGFRCPTTKYFNTLTSSYGFDLYIGSDTTYYSVNMGPPLKRAKAMSAASRGTNITTFLDLFQKEAIAYMLKNGLDPSDSKYAPIMNKKALLTIFRISDFKVSIQGSGTCNHPTYIKKLDHDNFTSAVPVQPKSSFLTFLGMLALTLVLAYIIKIVFYIPE